MKVHEYIKQFKQYICGSLVIVVEKKFFKYEQHIISGSEPVISLTTQVCSLWSLTLLNLEVDLIIVLKQ